MSNDPNLTAGLFTCHGLNSAQLQDFVDACIPARVPAGTLLIDRGDVDGSMLFVQDGELEVFISQDDSELVVSELSRGDHAGARSLLGLRSHRMASVRTRTAATLLILERESFIELEAQRHPVVKNLEAEVLRQLVTDLRELLRALSQIARGPVLPPPPPPRASLGLFERLASSFRAAGDSGGSRGDIARRLAPGDAAEVSSPGWLQGPHECVSLRAGEPIVVAGSDDRDAFYVLSGELSRHVASTLHGHIFLGRIHAGQLGGFESAVDSLVPPVTYVADQDCRVLRVPYSLAADAVIERSPQARALRRAMMETAAPWCDSASRLLFRGVARSLKKGQSMSLDHHPTYREACALVARTA